MISFFLSNFAAGCAPGGFFLIPSWYQYIYKAGMIKQESIQGQTFCNVHVSFFSNGHLDLSVVTLVALGVLDILLRLAALVATGFIIYAGVQYLTAQGEPEKAKHALGTIINALVGLGITLVAAATVRFLGERIAG